MKIQKLAIGLLILGGCSAPSIKSSKAEFITGPAPKGITQSQIETDLTRGVNIIGQFIAEIFPWTDPLIEVKTNEESQKSFENAAALKTRLATNKNLLGKTNCFSIHADGITIDSVSFKHWTGIMEVDGKQLPLTFSNVTGGSSIPRPSIPPDTGWKNSTIACTAERASFRSFKIKLNSLLNTGSEPAEASWSPPVASSK
jgi:hypothetical protein